MHGYTQVQGIEESQDGIGLPTWHCCTLEIQDGIGLPTWQCCTLDLAVTGTVAKNTWHPVYVLLHLVMHSRA